MRRGARWLILTVITVAPCGALGEEFREDLPPQPPNAPRAAATTYDVVFFGQRRPLFLRLHLKLDAQPLNLAYRRHVEETFKHLDRDRDARLSSAEFGRMNWGEEPQRKSSNRSQFFELLLSGVTGSKGGSSEIERIDLERFRKRYARRLPPFVIQGEPLNLTTGERVFTRLDLDRNGTVSPEEFSERWKSLRRLDANDDELIGSSELAQFINPFARQNLMRNDSPAPSPDFVSLADSHQFESIAYRLLSTYGEPPKPGLVARNMSADQLGLEANVVSAADANGDQMLDRSELQTLLGSPPRQIELAFSIAASNNQAWDASRKTIPLPVAAGGSPIGEVRLRRMDAYLKGRLRILSADPQQLVILYDQQQLEFTVAASSAQSYAQFFRSQFSAADGDNNEYLEEDEFNPRQSLFGAEFTAIDSDDDGKVFLPELLNHLRRQISHHLTRLEWNVLPRGRRLFQLLDTNADGQLSRRELSVSYEQLLVWDGSGNSEPDGMLQADEIPRSFTLTISTGSPSRVGGVYFGRQRVPSYRPDPALPDERPPWFSKADRNQDGEVSAREFPGPASIFDKLDRNGDQLISAEEASR